MVDPLEQFKIIFYEEGHEAIDAIEHSLMSLTSGIAEPETINDIFRAAHSLKGGSATFGMSVLTDFTHVMETLLDKVRASELTFSQSIVDCLFSSLDVLRNIVAHYQHQDELKQEQLVQVMAQLSAILEGKSSYETLSPEAPTDDLSTSAAGKSQEYSEQAACVWKIHFAPYLGIMCQGNDPIRYIEELGELGDIQVQINTQSLPDFSDLDPTSIYLSWDITLTSEDEVKIEDLNELFSWVEDDATLNFEHVNESTPVQITPTKESELASSDDVAKTSIILPEVNKEESQDKSAKQTAEQQEGTSALQPAPQADSKNTKRNSQSIRVALDKIDALINLLGELVITQSMLSVYHDSEKYPEFEHLTNGLAQLERHTRDLQEGVMSIRMLPIDFCFSRFPRIVRDLSKQLDKDIAIEIIGEHTEVDKTVIEELNDPLVHLVRNSADHGIESPEYRMKIGKPAQGTITVNAFNQVGNIVIEVKDDGGGLDSQKIREKAIKQGLLQEHETLSEQDLHQLIFTPGFSTVSEVTEVSGRGVGMDVVRQNIQRLGGLINVKSELGKGTNFSIRLPLTLAILDGQLIKVEQETYIIPMLSIIESIQVEWHEINQVKDKQVSFKWRDSYVPILDLAKALGANTEQKKKAQRGLIVIVEHDNKQCGLLVDDLTNHQQIVVKSLESNYAKVDEFSGATILGDGSVSLILNVAAMVNRVRAH